MTTLEEKQRNSSRRPDPDVSTPVIASGETFSHVTEQVSAVPLLHRKIPGLWYKIFGLGILLVFVFLCSSSYLIGKGIGILGNNIPDAWGYPITNFVWWIGIGHAGTLISAFLLLLNQSWRSSINRLAEAMTIFAVICAGMFPLLHLGRPWLFYWILPYPNTLTIQPQFRSPLVWDVFAVSTYATVSVVFWYLGMIPDFGTLRDQSKNKFAYAFYGILALGWRGASRHWKLHETASLLLAGLATPLVLSVHTVVSFDFTIAILPGWHSTIFPPYFVAGAIYSGFAMVLVLALPIRSIYGMENLLTERHINNCAKLMLTTGLILAYTYVIEPFTAWYSGDEFEMYVVHNRAFGPYAWAYWTVIACNVVIPQLLWFRKFRVSAKPLFAISIVVLYGMWLERYMLIITSLHRDFLPSSWGNFAATFWDNAILVGSIGVFITLYALFVRFLPMISMYEVRTLLPFSSPGGGSEK